ncbi:hypothetical protein AB1N83_006579 [Pleurotus pulmonarius]
MRVTDDVHGRPAPSNYSLSCSDGLYPQSVLVGYLTPVGFPFVPRRIQAMILSRRPHETLKLKLEQIRLALLIVNDFPAIISRRVPSTVLDVATPSQCIS